MGAIPHQQSTHALELHTLGNVCIDIGINEKQCIWGDESRSDYESLNGNLRLVLLTRGSKKLSYP